MNERIKKQVDTAVANIESRSQPEKILVLSLLIIGLGLLYFSLVFAPLQADISGASSDINRLQRQIQAQQTSYANMVQANQEDPNKFANDRLAVVAREQAELDREIAGLAGDLVTPNQMTQILISVLERQTGLELVHFENRAAIPLRAGISNIDDLLAETGAVNFSDVTEVAVAGQVYAHGLVLEFQGDYFNTLRYLRFLEEITGSFFWDSISFHQLQWPAAHVTLEIHTLSADEGFIGV